MQIIYVCLCGRGALEEVRLYFMERTQRWQELERICGFDIIQNPGLHVLETTLRGVGGTCKPLLCNNSHVIYKTMVILYLDIDHYFLIQLSL